jgi:hypothetical protein
VEEWATDALAQLDADMRSLFLFRQQFLGECYAPRGLRVEITNWRACFSLRYVMQQAQSEADVILLFGYREDIEASLRGR